MSYGRTSWKSVIDKTIFSTGLIVACLHAQVENAHLTETVSNIFVEAFTFESDQPGKGRVDIYVQVPYPEINFVKEGEQYTGRFDISAAVLSQEKQQLWQKSQFIELHVKDFSQTISNRYFNLKQFSTDITPGKYELLLQVTDQESKKVEAIKKSIVVRDFENDTLALSDVMLVRRTIIDSARMNIVPNLTGMIDKELARFYLFFEIYNHTQYDSVQLVCKFINSKREVGAQRSKSERLTGNRTQTVWQIDTLSIVPGKYVILVEAVGKSHADSGESFRASISRSCIVRMKNMSLIIADIDKAADQLQYIAQGSEISHIKEATTSDEKQKRFLEFWAKRSPDSKAPNNELMEEYFSRVEYANKNYTSFMEGWRTDRGMVLIRFGPPQTIERHPFDSNNKPYETWYYYNQNREFVFVDETGFGDYRLLYPDTDLWGRMR
jgi:GWxTD domain-containing protein